MLVTTTLLWWAPAARPSPATRRSGPAARSSAPARSLHARQAFTVPATPTPRWATDAYHCLRRLAPPIGPAFPTTSRCAGGTPGRAWVFQTMQKPCRANAKQQLGRVPHLLHCIPCKIQLTTHTSHLPSPPQNAQVVNFPAPGTNGPRVPPFCKSKDDVCFTFAGQPTIRHRSFLNIFNPAKAKVTASRIWGTKCVSVKMPCGGVGQPCCPGVSIGLVTDKALPSYGTSWSGKPCDDTQSPDGAFCNGALGCPSSATDASGTAAQRRHREVCPNMHAACRQHAHIFCVSTHGNQQTCRVLLLFPSCRAMDSAGRPAERHVHRQHQGLQRCREQVLHSH